MKISAKQFLYTVEQLAKEGRYRSALDMLLPVLEQNPDHPHLNRLGASIVFLATTFTYASKAREPLTDEYFYDRRLDQIYCQCDRCQSTWAPTPTIYFMKATLAITTGTNAYGGMFCSKCKKLFCADCINENMPMDETIMRCPDCKSHLDTPRNPNGRASLQTANRHQQQLILTAVFREGPIPPSHEYVNDLLAKLSPDVFLDNSKVLARPLFPWESKQKTINILMEFEFLRYMHIKPDMLDYYAYTIDDVHLCIIKAYQSQEISQFANDISCVYCGTSNFTDSWPPYGDMVPFYFQTEEDTKRTPGGYRIPVRCTSCNRDWYVVWDDDPNIKPNY